MERVSEEQMRGVAARLGFVVRKQASGRWVAINLAGPTAPIRRIGEDAAWRAAFEAVRSAHPLFLHKKGGIYRKLQDAKDADSGGDLVVYEHLWPHARGVWVRSAEEFGQADRFERL